MNEDAFNFFDDFFDRIINFCLLILFLKVGNL